MFPFSNIKNISQTHSIPINAYGTTYRMSLQLKIVYGVLIGTFANCDEQHCKTFGTNFTVNIRE